jgi:TonB family protein
MIGFCRGGGTILLLVALGARILTASQAGEEARLLAAITAQPEIVATHLDLASWYYRTGRRLPEAERELVRAIELIRQARGSEVPQPSIGTSRRLPRTGKDVPMPALVRQVAPRLPLEAAKAGVTGQVIIDAVIDKTGRVRDARVVRSIPTFDRAALAAVRAWRFAPTPSSMVCLSGSPRRWR